MSTTTLVATATTIPTGGFGARLRAWARQKSTIVGLATLATDASLIMTGATTWQVELPLAVGAVVAMVMPENTGLVQPTISLARDLLSAILRRDPATWALLIADAQAEATALGYGTTTTTTTTSPPPLATP